MLCLLADAGRASIISMKRMNKHQDKHLFPAAVEVSRSLLLSEKKKISSSWYVYIRGLLHERYIWKRVWPTGSWTRGRAIHPALSLSHTTGQSAGGIKKLVEQKIFFALLSCKKKKRNCGRHSVRRLCAWWLCSPDGYLTFSGGGALIGYSMMNRLSFFFFFLKKEILWRLVFIADPTQTRLCLFIHWFCFVYFFTCF